MKLFYYFLFAFWYLLSLLPLWFLYFLADLVYYPLYYVIRYRRSTVRKNLTESFPEKDLTEIIRIEKEFYQFFGDYVMETIKLFSMSKRQMRKRMTFGGLDKIKEDLETKSCILYMGHYCNWEWVVSVPLYLKENDAVIGQIYHPLENKAFNKLFLRLRGRYGAVNITMKEALRKLVRFRQNDQRFIIAFIADQAPNWDNIHFWTDFLNHKSAVFTGAERIAKSVDALVIYLDVTRVKRGHYHGEFIKMADSPKELPDYELTVDYTRRLEQTIRRAPQYWLWSHNRWKRTYEKYLKRKQS